MPSSLPYLELNKGEDILEVIIDTGSNKNYIQSTRTRNPILNEKPFYINLVARNLEITHHTFFNMFGPVCTFCLTCYKNHIECEKRMQRKVEWNGWFGHSALRIEYESDSKYYEKIFLSLLDCLCVLFTYVSLDFRVRLFGHDLCGIQTQMYIYFTQNVKFNFLSHIWKLVFWIILQFE